MVQHSLTGVSIPERQYRPQRPRSPCPAAARRVTMQASSLCRRMSALPTNYTQKSGQPVRRTRLCVRAVIATETRVTLQQLDIGSPVKRISDLGWRTDINDVYIIRERIGAGAFGQVYSGVHQQSGKEVAIKTLPKVRGKHSRERTLDRISKEITLMQRVNDCPGVARFYECFEDADNVQIVSELCRGGDLKKFVELHGPLDETTLAQVAFEALMTVQGFHARGVLYADVKPANFCIKEPLAFASKAPADFHLRAIDLGCSQVLLGDNRLSKRTGTLAYMAPEVFARNFGHKIDVWSTGVMLHWLFTQRLPFWDNDNAPKVSKVEDMAEVVSSAPITFDYGPWLHMSPEGVDFVRGCLTRPEDMRLGVEQALQHPWLRGHVGEEQQA